MSDRFTRNKEEDKRIIKTMLEEYGGEDYVEIYDIFKNEIHESFESVISDENLSIVDFRRKRFGTFALFVPDYKHINIYIRTKDENEELVVFDCKNDDQGISGRFYTWTINSIEDMEDKKEAIIDEIKEYMNS